MNNFEWLKKEINDLKKIFKNTFYENLNNDKKSTKKSLFIQICTIILLENIRDNIEQKEILDYIEKSKEKLNTFQFDKIKLVSTSGIISDEYTKIVYNKMNIEVNDNSIKLSNTFFVFYLILKLYNNDTEKVYEIVKKKINDVINKENSDQYNSIINDISNIALSRINKKTYDEEYNLFIKNLSEKDCLVIIIDSVSKNKFSSIPIFESYELISKIIEVNIPIILIEEHRLTKKFYRNIACVRFSNIIDLDKKIIKKLINNEKDFTEYDLKKINSDFIFDKYMEGDFNE